jgi:cytosine/adenosine deaminase-related metal-dependent hydrolase
MKVFAADYVVPISSEPIRGGAVAIEDDTVAAVGNASDLRVQFPEAAFEDLGEAAILPGFVNCHSHLEITSMRGLLDSVEHDFSSWLLTLNAARQKMTNAEIEMAAIAGAVEGARAGVTCFGDIGRFGKAGLEALKKIGLRGVLFQETEFSPDSKTADDNFKKLHEKYLILHDGATNLVEVGLSPHSPYTVSSKFFEKIADFALSENIKITVHAAESLDEKNLIENGDGFFVEVYEKFGFEWQSPRCSSIEFLDRTGMLKTKPLLAHCVTVSDHDIETIRSTGSTIAHCPKSNAKFGHGYAPFEKILDAGIAIGLGSDSVASNNLCDMLEESRFAVLTARNLPERKRFISAKEVLETATLGGAKALGLDQQIGSLEAGKKADIAIVSLTGNAQQPVNDIHAALVFSSKASDVRMTMVAGQTVFANGRVTAEDEGRVLSGLKQIQQKFSR